MSETKHIPKVIHYVWVGKNPLTPLAKKCIASWQAHMPDYELKLWDETNSPMTHPYVEHMYQKKKWAFVSDYIRFWVLAREGGVYLDTDTEVLRSFDDLLQNQVFFGKTKDGVTAAGVIGAASNSQCIKDILSVYDEDAAPSTERTSPLTVTQVLDQKEYPEVTVYDYHYFNPCDDGEVCSADKLASAYARNHWAESWVSFRRTRKLLRRLGILSMLKKFV